MSCEHVEPLQQMLDLAPRIASLCKPLFEASPIAYYGRRELYPDGKVYSIASHREYFQKFVEKSILGEQWLYMKRFATDHQRTGFILKDLWPLSRAISFPMFYDLGLGHACLFIEKSVDSVVRVHYFLGHLDDTSINEFYVNNTNLLRYFSRHMSKELAPDLRKTSPCLLPDEESEICRNWIENLGQTAKISIPKFLSSFAPHIALSNRQKELIYWHLMGKTSQETAIILGLKTATVRKYFDRLKAKFGCGTKNQILAELMKNGVCFPDLPKHEYFT